MRRAMWLVIAACGSTPDRSQAPARAPSTTMSSAVATDAGAAATILMQTDGDLDGDGHDEHVTLASDGTLVAGTAQLHIELDHPDPVFAKLAALRVITVGKRNAVLVTMSTDELEDPPPRHRIYLYDRGALQLAFDQVIGSYGGPELVAANGTLQYVEDGWMACTRENEHRKAPLPNVAKQLVTLGLDKQGAKVVELSRKPSGDVQACDQLAACPFVYELDDHEPQLAGEILRDLRRMRNEALQSLPLAAGTRTIRIAEAKPEVTYIDELYAVADGRRLAPRACVTEPALAFCVADHARFVLRQGDTLDVEFDTPPGAAIELFARGYYVPIPQP